MERRLSILDSLGIDVDKELLDALEDNEEFRDIKIKVIATKEIKLSREDDFLNKVDLVSVTFLDDADSEYDMRFWIVDKSIWPPTFSKPLAIESTVIDYQGEIFHENVATGDPNNFFIALFK